MTGNEFLTLTFLQMLQSMAGWLEKGRTETISRGLEPDAMLGWKLAPDMYPLAGQLRFACFLAQEPIYRVQGKEIPAELFEVREAGWASHEQAGTLSSATTLLLQTIDVLEQLKAKNWGFDADLPLAIELPNGMIFDMTAEQYIRDWALPQFYFHVGMAYAILRSNGIDLGKTDYVPHMFGYLRQDANG